MSKHQLITPRRNFLIRAIGFTAAGATVAVPITTLADAASRIDHHQAELQKALTDRYGGEVFSLVQLPEPGSIGFCEKTRRRYLRSPMLAFGIKGGGVAWLD